MCEVTVLCQTDAVEIAWYVFWCIWFGVVAVLGSYVIWDLVTACIDYSAWRKHNE